MVGTSRVVAAFLASLMIASPALAQPTREPSAEDRKVAGDLVKQAIAKSQAKEHLVAIELYLKAYARVPLAQLLSNVGTEYQSAKRPVEALRYFCMYLEKEPTGNLSGYATSQAKVLLMNLNGGKDIDDAAVCKAQVAPPDPKEQDPDIIGPRDPDTSITTTTPIERPDKGKGLKLTGMVLGGVGVVSLGIGLIYGKKAQDRSDFISNFNDPGTPWPAGIKEMEAEGATWEKIQIGGIVAGGVLLVAGGALYLVGRSKSAESMTVTPAPTPGGGGVVFSGRF